MWSFVFWLLDGYMCRESVWLYISYTGDCIHSYLGTQKRILVRYNWILAVIGGCLAVCVEGNGNTMRSSKLACVVLLSLTFSMTWNREFNFCFLSLNILYIVKNNQVMLVSLWLCLLELMKDIYCLSPSFELSSVMFVIVFTGTSSLPNLYLTSCRP